MKRFKRTYFIIFVTALFTTMFSCGTLKKAEQLKERRLAASISLPDKSAWLPELDTTGAKSSDTIMVTDPFSGKEMLIMKAVRNEDGEMVATDVIKAAMVTARFRNVAERNGKVDIAFNVTVPKDMQDSRWQLRFDPKMYIIDDSVSLDPVIITGRDYRKTQLKGYEQYEKWLSKIVNDSTRFINVKLLEIFLQRNIPRLFSFKNDSTFVSDEEFSSIYGVTEREAIEHYTNKFLRDRNERRKAKKDMMYHKYVKAPIITEGLRLDTVITDINGDFVYTYVQTITTRPKLRKVDIVMSGIIFEQDKRIYTIPRSEPLTFYISSLSAFVDNTEKYLTKVIERRAEENTACYIDFPSASSEILPELSENRSEMARIRGNIVALLQNKTFDLDSIIITASCSPEGAYSYNADLSKKRGESVCRHFNSEIRHLKDSMAREKGLLYNLDKSYSSKQANSVNISLISRANPENWEMLDALIRKDTIVTDAEKKIYADLSRKAFDERELAMKNLKCYRYLRERIYPRLRTVKFNFFLHRKGMIKDTVHTTVLDSIYMSGVQAIRDHDYNKAVTLLRAYDDYNSAVAFCAKGYDASAMAILERLDKTDRVNYMLAVLYSRNGNEREAVKHYMAACAQNRTYVSRGNLDPEISYLISRYALDGKEYFQ